MSAFLELSDSEQAFDEAIFEMPCEAEVDSLK